MLGNWNAGTPPMGTSDKVPEPASAAVLGLLGVSVCSDPIPGRPKNRRGVPEAHPGVGG